MFSRVQLPSALIKVVKTINAYILIYRIGRIGLYRPTANFV